ncbi:uncharacterized protein [Rutidosis leptorrhynchoides]|uniref:uncharacterized protein n=1 Tax=Rutidosis leptorrhynchoides TaxID=125765 RepID=UPI003A99ED97
MNRFSKDSNSSKFTWNWTRNPTGRTNDELTDLTALLHAFNFQNGSSDSWAWALQSNGFFTTQVLSSLVDSKLLYSSTPQKATDRLSFLPQKLGIFIWRVKQHRLPVRVELDKRGIDLDSVRCPVCNDGLETVEHVFVHCSFAKELWSRVFQWWNAGRSMYANLDEMFQGIHGSVHSSQASSLWKAIEWVCAYSIWQKPKLHNVPKEKTK